MAVFLVPPLTLQEAIGEAAASADVENFIYIDELHILTSSHEIIDDFSADRKLTIRPRPGLRRAVIASTDGWHPIFSITGAGYVTFQDLDIVRRCTNFCDLMFLGDCNNITIERCRIGSIWPSNVEAQDWSNLRVKDPIEVIVRNSIFFAYLPSTFNYGIRINFDTARGCSLLLYNNVVADYKDFGIHATSPQISDAFLLLRNNVVVNHPSIDPEPVPYRSQVFDMIVETSYNAAFVSLGDVETMAVGAQSISGEMGADFARRSRAQIDRAFVEHTWIIDPAWDPNPDFFRLVRGGPLHSEPADAGETVRNGDPHDRDVAVTDDIEKDVRPAGIPLHTDRGADQIREGDTFLDLGSLRLTPSVLPGCRVCVGKVVLNGIAPEGGWEIKIASTNPAATVPASVTIPAGATSQTFKITTIPVTTVKTGKVTATCRGLSRSRSLTVRPIGVASVKLSPTTVVGSKDVTGTVVLECEAAPGDIEVTLKSSSVAAVVPGSFTIPTGALSETFTIKTKPVSAVTSVTITATANGISKSATLKIKPG